MATRRDARLSTSRVEASLDAGLLNPEEGSLEVIDFTASFMLNICDQLR